MMLLSRGIVNISLVLRLKLYLIFRFSHTSSSNTNKRCTVLVGGINLHPKSRLVCCYTMGRGILQRKMHDVSLGASMPTNYQEWQF